MGFVDGLTDLDFKTALRPTRVGAESYTIRAEDWNRVVQACYDLRTAVLAAQGQTLSIWAGGRASYGLNTPALVVGAFEFNKSSYSFSTIKFRAVGARGDSVTAVVELYNLSDASSVATLQFTNTATTLQESADISASLPAVSKLYEVRIYLNSAPGASDSVELFSAFLQVNP